MALPIPVDRQREVVYLAGSGHNVVLGTAGSGKTSMAILRAAYLSDIRLPDSGRALLITFNKTLGTYIRHLAENVLDRVVVENFHLFARGYLNARGLLGGRPILPSQSRQGIILAALQIAKAAHPSDPLFARPISFFEEEIKWIAQHGIASLEVYETSTRSGRADARILRTQRPLVWAVYESYLKSRLDAGYRYDLDDLASAALQALEADTSERRYKHVIIDEGQDLSPMMLRALAKAVPASGSLTFFGDIAQQIYGHRMSWKSAGLKPTKIWNFEENYRNTRAIADLALAISHMPYYAEAAADLVVPRQPSAAGPLPTLIHFSDEDAEIDYIVRRATAYAQGRSVAILTRTREQARRIIGQLSGNVQLLKGEITQWRGGPGISCGTMHNGKGLEFDVVLLPFLSAERFPNPIAVDSMGLEEANATDGRLLYVGVTRARSELLMTYTGEPTPLLPTDSALYTRVSR